MNTWDLQAVILQRILLLSLSFFVLYNRDAWRLLLSLFIFHYFSSTWSLQAASLQRLLLLLLCKLQACRDFHHLFYLKYLNSIDMVEEVIIITFAFVNTWALQAAGMHWSLLKTFPALCLSCSASCKLAEPEIVVITATATRAASLLEQLACKL